MDTIAQQLEMLIRRIVREELRRGRLSDPSELKYGLMTSRTGQSLKGLPNALYQAVKEHPGSTSVELADLLWHPAIGLTTMELRRRVSVDLNAMKTKGRINSVKVPGRRGNIFSIPSTTT